jgi:altronate hydrolase
MHPNTGGVFLVGLGCENLKLNMITNRLKKYNHSIKRTKTLMLQSTKNEIKKGISYLSELNDLIKRDKKTKCSISKLKIGLKCGGSDGFSGIYSNSLIGKFSDYIIDCGSTTVLTEVPEMFGAETILMSRAKNKKVFEKIVDMINNFKEYFIKENVSIYENPSPGNLKGGISTLEDKSLGCVQKSGHSQVKNVLNYGELISNKGLNLLYAPGNDLVSSTTLAASGCQLILFSTGLGTPFGTFVPTIKISSNTKIFNDKPSWIDFNASTSNINEFIDYIFEVINGLPTNNEKYKQQAIAIFKTGVTL